MSDKTRVLILGGGFGGLYAALQFEKRRDSATGDYCPPTAQHASREGKVLAHNIIASVNGKAKKPFKFQTLGLLAAIGRRTGVARILGVNFSGFIAWFLWRGIYWSKLPRMEKKVRVAIDWALDVFFRKTSCSILINARWPHRKLKPARRRGIAANFFQVFPLS
jgi:NADH dehydrogenase